ncbi:YheC/YheD family protein [Bacillus sp. BGMRC 2118]|nr:YheC/YheD family protein [Bacillus sp. BGMRC 2118]
MEKGGLFMNGKLAILVSDKKVRKLRNGKRAFSNETYEESANSLHLQLYYVSIRDVTVENRSEVRAISYNYENDEYVETKISLPKVIYNRVSLKSKKNRQKVRHLHKQGYIVYNSFPFKNGKWLMYEMLKNDPELAKHLPKTVEANEENIKLMMTKFSKLFIKPCHSSIGKGIMYMERIEMDTWLLHYRDQDQQWQETYFSTILPRILLEAISSRPFIVQETIPLATYEGRTFDTRVIVQRDQYGDWSITGMVGKLAQEGHSITNVGQGGDFADILTYLETNPHFTAQEICQNIEELALRIARYLEPYCYHIADLGMDIGIAVNGDLFFIECNFRSQYAGMEKNTLLLDVCKNIFSNPIRYGSFLLRQTP